MEKKTIPEPSPRPGFPTNFCWIPPVKTSICHWQKKKPLLPPPDEALLSPTPGTSRSRCPSGPATPGRGTSSSSTGRAGRSGEGPPARGNRPTSRKKQPFRANIRRPWHFGAVVENCRDLSGIVGFFCTLEMGSWPHHGWIWSKAKLTRGGHLFHLEKSLRNANPSKKKISRVDFLGRLFADNPGGGGGLIFWGI